ncbi:hypothetical protein [Mesorhizobium sangaii]|uniref:Glycine-rich cell wall protein n=1 Tax=Mesorhizobium sangaii TaxID=505389 RepID=A0A841PMV3_9HYPH|nr:hypothetical protein [Mesorhizobium sangaii]MBB6409785.1 hypothetical protein [Mesorhizobium sangaii]
MRRSIATRCCWLALRATSALALAIAPYQLAFHGSDPGIVAASAHARDGGHGGGGGGGGGSGSGGSGGSGNGNSGNAGGANGASDDHGAAGNSGVGKGHDDHVNAKTGDRVEVDGNKIEVLHPDGITEEIENGRFQMKDALGRTIVERPATANDISRLRAL